MYNNMAIYKYINRITSQAFKNLNFPVRARYYIRVLYGVYEFNILKYVNQCGYLVIRNVFQ